MAFSSPLFFFVLQNTGFPRLNVEITAVLQQCNQSHFNIHADKVRIAHSDWPPRPVLTIAKLEYKIRDSLKKKKKIESIVIHSKKALQTADTVQKNRRRWPFYYRLFCSVALLSQAHPPAAAHTRTHPHTHTLFSSMLSQIITLRFWLSLVTSAAKKATHCRWVKRDFKPASCGPATALN